LQHGTPVLLQLQAAAPAEIHTAEVTITLLAFFIWQLSCSTYQELHTSPKASLCCQHDRCDTLCVPHAPGNRCQRLLVTSSQISDTSDFTMTSPARWPQQHLGTS
jgi:hypothetical protein